MSDSSSLSSLHTKKWLILVVLVAIASFVLGSRLSASDATATGFLGGTKNSFFSVRGVGSRPPATIPDTVDFQQFWNVWNLLKTKYYKQPLDEQAMFYGALSGLAGSTGDPYTTFFSPKDAQDFSESLQGKFDGVGAVIGIKDDQLQVIAPLPETPASKAGLLAGDAILSIDATSTEGMSVDRAVALIRGKKGTHVVLSIGRITNSKDKTGHDKKEVKRFDSTLVRDTILVKSVQMKALRDNVVLITITGFNADTATEFSKTVTDVLTKDPKGIVLDLRNDPGGFLDRATAVAGEWVGDQIVVTERRQGKKVDEYHGIGGARLKQIPTIVLVNQGSASASEIVAGALQDYGMAKLVGKKTFGKGSVQDYMELGNGMAIKITIAEWLTPKGRSIHNVGITPDVEVDRTEDDYHAERDPQLEKALELLTGSSSTSTPTTPPKS